MFKRRDVVFILFLLACLVWAACGFPSCEPSGNTGQLPTEPIRDSIKVSKAKSDSVGKEIQKHEPERKEAIKRYRAVRDSAKSLTSKPDSLSSDTSCASLIRLVTSHCDSVIAKDSAQFARYQGRRSQDSLTIAQQGNLIIAQDLTIIDLTKKVKREKRRTRFAVVIAGILAGLAVAK